MAIYKHESVIATLWGESDIPEVLAFREGIPEWYRHLLIGPAVHANGFTTFVLAPDGAPESSGEDSHEMDVIRAAFIELLKGIRADWAHVILYDETYHAGLPEDVSRIVASSRWTFDGENFRPDNGLSWLTGRDQEDTGKS